MKFDETNFNLLKDNYLKNNVVPVIGSGFSVDVIENERKFLSWKSFLLEYARSTSFFDQINSILENSDVRYRYEYAANELSKIDGAFLEKLQKSFVLKEGYTIKKDCLVNFLPCLFPSGLIITTNIDEVIEHVYENNHKHFDVCYGRNLSSSMTERILREREHVLVKIHGSVSTPESIVFNEQQYNELYGKLDSNRVYVENDNKFINCFKTMAKHVHFLFLGCSLIEDRYLDILHWVREENKINSNFHFAILPVPQKKDELCARERFLADCGIVPIWYKNGHYQEIGEYLHKLYEAKGLKENRRKHVNKINFINDNIAIESKKKGLDNNLLKDLLDPENEWLKNILKKKDRNDHSSILMRICNYIMTANDTCPMIITGLPGTGKSTFISLIYLKLREEKKEVNTIFFKLQCLSDAESIRNDLDSVNKKIRRNILNIICIDVGNNIKNKLAQSIKKYFGEWQSKENVRFIIAIRSNNREGLSLFSKVFPNYKDDKKIELKLFNTSSNKFSSLSRCLLSILLPETYCKNQTKLHDKIITFCRKIAGNYTDFRTISFVIKRYIAFKKRENDLFSANIADVFRNSFSAKSVTVNNLAFQILFNKRLSSSLVDYQSISFTNYVLSAYYINNVRSWNRDFTFTANINRFIIASLTRNEREEQTIARQVMRKYDTTVFWNKIQIVYLLGRVKHDNTINQAKGFLKEKYEILKKELTTHKNNTNETYMLFRSLGISLLYICKNDEVADDFCKILINDGRLKELNLGFHIQYFTSSENFIAEVPLLENISLSEDQFKSLHRFLKQSISRTNEKGRLELNIITFISLLVYWKNTIDIKFDVNKSLEFLEKINPNLIDTSVQNYIKNVSAFLRITNIYTSYLEKIYFDDSVKPYSHYWQSCILANSFLPDKIEDCQFLSNTRKWIGRRQYNKKKIISMLLELGLSDELNIRVKSILPPDISDSACFSSLSVFPAFRSINYLGRVDDEYNSLPNINVEIVHQIEIVNSFLQSWVNYKNKKIKLEDFRSISETITLQISKSKLNCSLGDDLILYLKKIVGIDI